MNLPAINFPYLPNSRGEDPHIKSTTAQSFSKGNIFKYIKYGNEKFMLTGRALDKARSGLNKVSEEIVDD